MNEWIQTLYRLNVWRNRQSVEGKVQKKLVCRSTYQSNSVLVHNKYPVMNRLVGLCSSLCSIQLIHRLAATCTHQSLNIDVTDVTSSHLPTSESFTLFWFVSDLPQFNSSFTTVQLATFCSAVKDEWSQVNRGRLALSLGIMHSFVCRPRNAQQTPRSLPGTCLFLIWEDTTSCKLNGRWLRSYSYTTAVFIKMYTLIHINCS